MLVFAIFEPGRSRELAGVEGEQVEIGMKSEGVNAISVCLFIGALSSMGAAYATRKFGSVS